MAVLGAIALLLLCQLAGELVASVLALPVPGPVLGMAFLFLVLALLRRIPSGMAAVSDGLLRVMPLFFVPAGVGVLTLSETFREAWLPIVVGLIASTVFALAVTAFAAQGVMLLTRRVRACRRTASTGSHPRSPKGGAKQRGRRSREARVRESAWPSAGAIYGRALRGRR